MLAYRSTVSPSKPHHVALVAVLLALAACGGPAARKGGPSTRTTPPPGARPGDEAVVDDGWGVGLLVDPAITITQVDDERFSVNTLDHGDLEAGVFLFRVLRHDQWARAGSAAYIEMVREQYRRDGMGRGMTDPAEVRFLGRPGHAVTFQDEDKDANVLWVAMVQGRCLFELVVMRSGPPDWMTDYASLVLRNIKSLTAKPVAPARCQ